MADSAPLINLTGLASGLDTNSIVSALMQVESQPKQLLANQQVVVQARQSALNDIATKLRALDSAAAALRDPTLFSSVQTVASSDAGKVSARQVSGAAIGGYEVQVTQLARSEQRWFSFSAPASDTALQIDYQLPGGSPQTYTANVTAGTTIDQLVSQINADSAAPVYAANVNGQLVLSHRTTGAAATFTATASFLAEDTNAHKAGQDAQFTVDGGSVQSSASNVVTTAIPGVELTLKGVTDGSVSVTVGAPAPDPDKVKSAVHAFVDAYNAAVDLIQSKLSEKKVVNPSSDADRAKGVLFGDFDLTNLLSRMRTTVSQTFSGAAGGLTSLFDLGVSTGSAVGSGTLNTDSVSGRLTVDDAKLTAALQSSPTGVQQILGASGAFSGFGQAFGATLAPWVQAGGDLDSRVQSAASEISDLSAQMASWDERLAAREQALRAQFASLESLLSQNQSQQAWLSSQIAALGSGG